MGQISLQIPQLNQPDTTEDVKVQNNFSAIQNAINGNIDSTNLAAVAAQSAGINQSGQTVKGSSIIATSESRSSTAYGTMPTPDQVTGLVLPVNGLIAVWYQATWQESVQGGASAAIFLNTDQLRFSPVGTASPQLASTFINAGGSAGVPVVLTSGVLGLHSMEGTGTSPSSYTGDVATGQIVGGGNLAASDSGAFRAAGGPCYIFAAAGTYTISVQFKASSGSVTASNRRLWVQALSFA